MLDSELLTDLLRSGYATTDQAAALRRVIPRLQHEEDLERARRQADDTQRLKR